MRAHACGRRVAFSAFPASHNPTPTPSVTHIPSTHHAIQHPRPLPTPSSTRTAHGAPAPSAAHIPAAPPRPAAGKPQTYVKDKEDPYANVGRNDPCPCGSGKKFKKCHGQNL